MSETKTDPAVDKDLIPVDNGTQKTDDKSPLNESGPDSNPLYDDFFKELFGNPVAPTDEKKVEGDKAKADTAADEFQNPDKDPAIYEEHMKTLQEKVKGLEEATTKLSELEKIRGIVDGDEFLKKIVEKSLAGEKINLSEKFKEFLAGRSKSTVDPDKARAAGNNRGSGKATSVDDWLGGAAVQGYNHGAK